MRNPYSDGGAPRLDRRRRWAWTAAVAGVLAWMLVAALTAFGHMAEQDAYLQGLIDGLQRGVEQARALACVDPAARGAP